MDEARAEFIAGLRAVADLYEDEPEFPLPYLGGAVPTFQVGAYSSPERFAELVRLLGGNRTKDYTDSYAKVTRDFGGGVRVEVWAERDQVCTRRQVGVTTELQRDPSAPMVEVEVPVWAYDCSAVLDGEREAVS